MDKKVAELAGEWCKKADTEFEDLRDVAEDITPYAVEIRYPDDFVDMPVGEVRESVDKSKK